MFFAASSAVPPRLNPSAWLSERNRMLPVREPVKGPVAKEGQDDDEPDDPVNVKIAVMFAELSSVRFAVKVVFPGVYWVDAVVPVHDALCIEGMSTADTLPISSFTPQPDVFVL